MNKKYFLTYRDKEVAIVTKKYINEDLGTVVDISIYDGTEIKTITNALININFEELEASSEFATETARVLSDPVRYERVVKARSSNFGAIKWENGKVRKYTYDKKAARSDAYRDENNLRASEEKINPVIDKVIYKYKDTSFFATVPLVETDEYYVGIEFLTLDQNAGSKNNETGDLINIYVVDASDKVTKFENFFVKLAKTLLILDEDYRVFVGEVLSNFNRNTKALNEKAAYLGIITKVDKPLKLTNSNSIKNIELKYSGNKAKIFDYTGTKI